MFTRETGMAGALVIDPENISLYLNVLNPKPLLLLALAGLAAAQTPPPSTMTGPITRVLAIGKIVGLASREKIMPVMQKEVRDTVRLYLAGKLAQWFARKDQNGVVFLLNVTSVAEARELLEKLPLGEAKLMEFELIPLGPLTPLGLLLQESTESRQTPVK